MKEELTLESMDKLLFHIEVGDYFATLATNLSLLNQVIESGDIDLISELTVLDSAIADLMFLQKNYKIEKKVHD